MKDKRCGTSAGYSAHRKRKEKACKECLAIHAIKKKEWRKAHPEYDSKAYYKKYYEKNKDYVLQKHKEYYVENRDNALANKQRYHKEKPEVARQSGRRRRAKKLTLGTDNHTEQQVLELYGTNCHLCGEPINMKVSGKPGSNPEWQMGLHIDHLIPLIKGGPDTLKNVRPSHAVCNLRKNRN